ncbi:reverse transcriptase family protein [Nakamurella sp.]|uniref:reverse transcriptase family protein n=1 Tax=Nakamurella sp. TaxID=1869182 RepID=UPI003B3B12C5
MSGPADRLATALADAMLAGSWSEQALLERTRRVIDRRPPWLTSMVREVLAAYHRPPADRPRELAAFVRQSAAMARALTSSPRLPAPVIRLSSPTRMIHRPFPTPVLDHTGDLADHLGITLDALDTFADPYGRARRAHRDGIAHYRYRWLHRPRGARLIEAPKPDLRALQRTILDDLLSPIPIHPAVHGFVAGRSPITGAAEHVGADVAIALDIEHFFASITPGRIWGVLRAAGYPEPVAHLLVGLTTHATPVAALRAMPVSADPGRDARLGRRLAAPHLPQGAPTSPALANLVAFSLDRRLDSYARAAGARYTRYADDLTFSGDHTFAQRSGALVAAVEKMIQQEGFAVHPGKTRECHRHRRQTVTGIVVNDRTNVPRPDYDQLKAVLHDCRRNGPRAANRNAHHDFRAHLLGRISWVGALNPARGARLRALFDEIDWTG